MKMQALVALRAFPYAGKQRKPGDVFQASPKDARILIALKRAQADPAGAIGEAAGATETAPGALVRAVMGMAAVEQPRKRGRPRRAAETAE